MEACKACPNRMLALFSERLGETGLAATIREAGCPWWQVHKIEEDPGFKVGCVAEGMDGHFRRYGGFMLLAADAIQKDRNEQAEALEEVKEAIRHHGGGAVLQALGTLGLLSAQAAMSGEDGPVEDSQVVLATDQPRSLREKNVDGEGVGDHRAPLDPASDIDAEVDRSVETDIGDRGGTENGQTAIRIGDDDGNVESIRALDGGP